MTLKQFLTDFVKTVQSKEDHKDALIDLRSSNLVVNAITSGININMSENKKLLNNMTGIMICDFDREDTNLIQEMKKTIEKYNGLSMVCLNSRIYGSSENVSNLTRELNNEENEIYGVFNDMMSAYNCYNTIINLPK